MSSSLCLSVNETGFCRTKPVRSCKGCIPSSRKSRRLRGRADAMGEIAMVALDGQQAGLLASILKPTLTIVEFLFIMRIVMSWDPQFDTDKKLPWAIFYKPTEPILGPTRKVIKPIGGVDISPIIWTFILSLANEILLGPQGILVLIERQGGL
jgi:uncharacterized protein YggT (Ycf19 family)